GRWDGRSMGQEAGRSPMKIFLSYSSQNRARVEPVNFALAAQGHDVFFDRDDLSAGTEYDQRIIEAVEGADLFVFMLSPASIRPGSYALTELSLAQKKWTNPSGRVLPVAVEPVAFDHIPPYLKSVTVLEPIGNLAAAVVDAVRRLATARRGPRRAALIASAVVVVAVAIAAWFFSTDRQKTVVAGKDGVASVLVPAATFTMGDGEDSPLRTVHVDAFYLDRFEVTTGRFGKFLEATGAVSQPDGWDEAKSAAARELPVVGVDWREAEAYCRWAGKRLPTDSEWERAARGTEARIYPWGNDAPGAERARFATSASGPYQGGLASVGSHAAGQSSEGIQDLAGNASEWVADWYSESFATSDVRNPKGPESGTGKGIRGGGWQEPAERLRSAKRFHATPDHRADDVGFRCARDAVK
ncbi:MAG: SUMF1/EgtB/PvdO family nonheme iron enzyme, partial [Chloroflexota bacterium]|nr:SUMF1/EgtB/PvdO family nonheme iron enzyme [Chloroflexota bacterium]